MQAIADLETLLARMQPVLNPGCFAFVALPSGGMLDPALVVASIREPEGLSVICTEHVARDMDLPIAFIASWITLAVHSDLAAVGLTAAFSSALARAGVSCNVVAGVHHDHLFVPTARAGEAFALLSAMTSP